MIEIDTSALRDDPIIVLASQLYAEHQHDNWDDASVAMRRAYIRRATVLWLTPPPRGLLSRVRRIMRRWKP